MFIYGQNIKPEYLYELIGKNNYFLTVFLKETSELRDVYPATINGTLYYTQDERSAIKNDKDFFNNTNIIKIESSMLELNGEQIRRLKHIGIDCSEIAVVTFLPLSNETTENEQGIKKFLILSKSHILKNMNLSMKGLFSAFMVVSYLKANYYLKKNCMN